MCFLCINLFEDEWEISRINGFKYINIRIMNVKKNIYISSAYALSIFISSS